MTDTHSVTLPVHFNRKSYFSTKIFDFAQSDMKNSRTQIVVCRNIDETLPINV